MNASHGQSQPGGGSPALDALLLERSRELARDHLEALPTLFKSLTRMDAGVAWATAWPRDWSGAGLPTQSRLCQTLAAAGPAARARCRRCGLRHLGLTLDSAKAGHLFVCRQGVRNFWFPIIIRHCAVCLAYIQAPSHAVLKPPVRSQSGHAPIPQACRRRPARPPGSGWGLPMGRTEFERAAALLRLIFLHVKTSVLADLRREDLTKAQQALLVFESVQTRLRQELNGVVPWVRKTPPVPQLESHPNWMVRAVLNRIHQDYAQPLTLQKCARELRVNASYLSHLFSQAVGLPFRTCLTEVRIEKARELLSNPGLNISEVAAAVGYASDNRFRIAFKKATGLPPHLWRATLHMPPSANPVPDLRASATGSSRGAAVVEWKW